MELASAAERTGEPATSKVPPMSAAMDRAEPQLGREPGVGEVLVEPLTAKCAGVGRRR